MNAPERRRAPRRLADVLQMFESARTTSSADLSAALSAVLAARGIDVAAHGDAASLRDEVARALAASARVPDRRGGGRRATDSVG